MPPSSALPKLVEGAWISTVSCLPAKFILTLVNEGRPHCLKEINLVLSGLNLIPWSFSNFLHCSSSRQSCYKRRNSWKIPM